nr:hypothetical protein [Tanacetum cinerariifolium]
MMVLLPSTVNLYHDEVFHVNHLEYIHFDSRVIDDASFDGVSFKDFLLPLEDDVAHVVEQFEHENKGSVNIPKMTTDDPWLNKLVENPDDKQVKSKFKAKKDVSYPFLNPDTPWNECKLVLGMRYKSPQQLKHMLANYVVQHGYQLWYMQNDHNKRLVFYGMHIYANFKKRWSGLQFKRPFLGAGTTSMELVFLQKMEEIKMLDDKAHEWLMERNPNSWCREYFEMYRCGASFENGISESFPQGLHLLVFPSGYREVEVRRRDYCFGVNLHQMKYVCNMWQLRGIPCVYAMAGQPPPLPPVERKMSDRPRKKRIIHPIEDDDHVITRVGRVMYCHNCYETCCNKTRCPKQERPKPAYLRSNGIVFQEAPSSSMPPPTATPSTSNTMPPPPTPSTLNIILPHPTPSPSTSNTMPPPSGSNDMPPPLKPSGSNIMPSHATPGSNTSVGSNTMSSHVASALTRTKKGKCPLIPKKEADMPKSSASSSIGGSRGGATNRGVSRGGAKGGESKKDEEHQFKMDMEVVYEMEREQMEIDEEDQFWEEYAREFDHVEEHKAQDKGMPEDVANRKQPMTKDVAIGK